MNELGDGVKRGLEETVVDILSLSSCNRCPFPALQGYSSAEWERCLTWMDDTGLALYFLHAIEQTTDAVPEFVIQRLRNKRHANEERTSYMQRQFEFINRGFENIGIRYSAVKGLTLEPTFCPDVSLRHQSDFDYLTDLEGLYRGSLLLQEMGYVLHKESDHERIFVHPDNQGPKRGDAQYAASAAHSVELHLTIGHFPHLAWKEPVFLENAVTRRFHGSTFQGLSDADSFILQALHSFHHLLGGWLKLSWLYEIAHFLDTRAPDTDLCQTISKKLSADPLLREAVAVIVSLASQLFQVQPPASIENWITEIRPAVRIWIEKYARVWTFGPNRIDEFEWFPTSKLVLFLHQQYVPDRRDWRGIALARLLALNGLKRISRSAISKRPSKEKSGTRLSAREFRRIAFHLGSDLRYMWEVPRWWHWTRTCPPNGSSLKGSSSPAA